MLKFLVSKSALLEFHELKERHEQLLQSQQNLVPKGTTRSTKSNGSTSTTASSIEKDPLLSLKNDQHQPKHTTPQSGSFQPPPPGAISNRPRSSNRRAEMMGDFINPSNEQKLSSEDPLPNEREPIRTNSLPVDTIRLNKALPPEPPRLNRTYPPTIHTSSSQLSPKSSGSLSPSQSLSTSQSSLLMSTERKENPAKEMWNDDDDDDIASIGHRGPRKM